MALAVESRKYGDMKKRRGGCHRMAANYASEACATYLFTSGTHILKKWDDVRIPSHLREIIMVCHSLMDSV